MKRQSSNRRASPVSWQKRKPDIGGNLDTLRRPLAEAMRLSIGAEPQPGPRDNQLVARSDRPNRRWPRGHENLKPARRRSHHGASRPYRLTSRPIEHRRREILPIGRANRGDVAERHAYRHTDGVG